MAHCPSCEKEIDHLTMTTDERHYFHARLPKEGDEEDRDVELYNGGIAVTEEGDTKILDGEFFCPECGAEVASSTESAVDLLKGE